MKSVIIIPARLKSTRLPRKLLLNETGKSLIQHTYETALRARLPSDVIVATDDAEIGYAIAEAGGRFHMTSTDIATGTDRVAVVAEELPDVDIVVNVQGDEPELDPASIDLAIQTLEDHPTASMSTLATPIRSNALLKDPSCVKVVFDHKGRALYFSRSKMPYCRDWSDDLVEQEPPLFWQHIGLYAYRREFLLNLAKLPPTANEKAERLEQLRVLENGFTILVATIDRSHKGIDTADDYQAFVKRMRS